MSEALQPEEMADLSDLYATVDKSKKRKSIVDKEESRVTSENCGEISNASFTWINQTDYHEAKDAEESAKVGDAKIDHSKLRKSPVHIYSTPVNTKSLPDYNAKCQKNKLLYILIAASFLTGLILLAVNIVLFVRFLPLNDEKIETLNMSINVLLENFASLTKVIETLNVSINDHLIAFISPGYTTIPASCADIIEQNVSSISGYYFVRSHSGQLVSVYCDMKRSCDGIIGGWMRVAKLDVQNCPLELEQKVFTNDTIKEFENIDISTCVVQDNSEGCTSVFYSSHDIPYSRVCGNIRAYQVGSFDGFMTTNESDVGLDGNYLDGISITISGDHVWSFVAGGTNSENNIMKPNFVGDNWTSDEVRGCPIKTLCKPLLWESQQFGRNVSYWFKELLQPSVTDIEVRICRDEQRRLEDLAITTLEINVQ